MGCITDVRSSNLDWLTASSDGGPTLILRLVKYAFNIGLNMLLIFMVYSLECVNKKLERL
jgi:hypothetical protein